MSGVSLIILTLLILGLSHQMLLFQQIVIFSKKRLSGYLILVFLIGMIVTILYRYANKWTDYVQAVLGVCLLVIIWMRQGLSHSGIITIYNWKQPLKWSNVNQIFITRLNKKRIKMSGQCIPLTLHFDINEYEQIKRLLDEHLENKNYYYKSLQNIKE